MFNKKIDIKSESKLSKTLNSTAEGKLPKKKNFMKDKSFLSITKSYKLRESDLTNLKNIATYVNNQDDRKRYSDAQIIRGLINYFAEHLDKDYQKLIQYIRTSS